MSNIQKAPSLQGLLSSDNIKERLEDILGKRASTFATSVIQITRQNDMLSKAVPQSIVGSAMTAATLNLPLNNSLGYAYIIPFNERQKDGSFAVKAQFQIGWKGFLQLAMRSGQFVRVNATDVKEGEIKSQDRLSGDITFDWIQDDTDRIKAKTVGYVAYFRLKNGYEATLYMTVEELNKHGKRFSQTFKKGFGLWKDDFDSMAKKTVIKLLLSKKAPLSIDMQTATDSDQGVIEVDEDGEIQDAVYSDNKTTEIDADKERLLDFINGIDNLDDVEFAKGQIGDDKVLLAQLKAKEVELKKRK